MSSISSDPCALLCAYRAALAGRRWRGLVWLSGSADDCRERARALWRAEHWRAPLWVAAAPPPGIAEDEWLPAGKARTRLGGEHGLIVFDAASIDAGFDPDAFGALAGTLSAGGLVVLMTPDDWGMQPDADYARLAEHPWRAGALTSRYLVRLAAQLSAAGEAVHWRAGATPEIPALAPAAEPPLPPQDKDCLSRDQEGAVARLVSLRRRRPLVITADRGRGKTAALGIACARLLARGVGEILLTAPRPAAVEGVFERLAALCPDGERRGNDFVTASGRLTFLAPDALQARVEAGEAGGAGRWLLVDEAAALPARLLGAWLEAFPRLAFATTVHGYEGAGRGFALRFRQRLDSVAPGWREYKLVTPIRWAEGDPLEALTARLLMLDAEPRLPEGTTWHRSDEPRDILAADEPCLRDLFGLLVQAHYRTTPSDLRRLLDGPALRIACLSNDSGIGAVAVSGDEGGFDPGLADRVARGERRPRGHLMAQSLAAHAGERQALSGRLRRVWRIAVAAECRRRGLGAELLRAELRQAAADDIDLLGASFGADPGLLAFWRSQGFRVVRLGLTREAASGEHAVMVARATSTKGEALMQRLRRRFERQLPGLLAFELAALEPDIVLALLADGEAPPPLSPDDQRDLTDVAQGHREPALVRPALQALVALLAVQGQCHADLVKLAAWAFQGRDDAWLARCLSLPGRRQVDHWRRRVVAQGLEALALSKPDGGR